MVPNRLRIRFTKEGDLRLISHRDLVRAMERLFRRANVPLAMSQGFHPKVRMTIPSALALGIAGRNEVMDVRLAEDLPAEEVRARLSAHAPVGIQINSAAKLAPESSKARVESAMYRVEIPAARRAQVARAVAELLAQESYLIQRGKGKKTLDLLADLQELRLDESALVFTLRIRQEGAVRATEVLTALGAADLTELGYPLARTDVEIAS